MRTTANVTADTVIRCDPQALWDATQTPGEHARWDARFSTIEYEAAPEAGQPRRFRYVTRIGFGLTVSGWGETVGGLARRGSALRFGSDDHRSLIREGAGSWTYRPVATADGSPAIHFGTVYDYRVRYGRLGRFIDRVAFRPLMRWATRWSFDRLRLWLERGLEPELALRVWLAKVAARTGLALVWVYEGLLPKLLFTTQHEMDLVARSRLFWPTPKATLFALAVGEIVGGIWLLTGRAERAAAWISIMLLVGLGAVCAAHEPGLLHHPFGGFSKNLGLIACAVVVLLLSDVAPDAGRATRGAVGGNNAAPTTGPIQAALGSRLDAVSPAVREHFTGLPGTHLYGGVMRRVWRRTDWRGRLAAPALWLAPFANLLFPDTGSDVPFELEHTVVPREGDHSSIRFRRTFRFHGKARRFDAHLTFDPVRNVIIDRLGRGGLLEVELHPWVEERSGALCLRSGRQWVRLARFLRVRIPRWAAGAARVREWQEAEGRLGVSVVIHNPLLGDFFGYEGTFAPVPQTEQSRPPVATTKEVGP